MNTVPVLETDAEIIAALREKKDFNSNVLTARQEDLAYVFRHDEEILAFFCKHDDLYINMDPSKSHLVDNLSTKGPIAAFNLNKFDDIIHAALFPLLQKESVALCDVARFFIACTIHGIASDAFIDQNIKERGQSPRFIKLALGLISSLED